MNRALLVDILEEQYDVIEVENDIEAISLLFKAKEQIFPFCFWTL